MSGKKFLAFVIDRQGKTRPCPEVYRYEQDLIKRLNHGVDTIQCRESFCNVAVRELLYGHQMSTDRQEQKALSAESTEIIQLLHSIAEQQDKLQSEVLAEQKEILQRLNAITVQQSKKEAIPYQSSDIQQYDIAPYNPKSRYDEAPEPSSEPPTLLKQAWDWYKRQQPPKQKKPLSKFKIGCFALIVGFFLCSLLSKMYPSNQPLPHTSNNTLSTTIQSR